MYYDLTPNVYCVASDHLVFKTHVVIQLILVASQVCVIFRASCSAFVLFVCLLADACADVHGIDTRSADSTTCDHNYKSPP